MGLNPDEKHSKLRGEEVRETDVGWTVARNRCLREGLSPGLNWSPRRNWSLSVDLSLAEGLGLDKGWGPHEHLSLDARVHL